MSTAKMGKYTQGVETGIFRTQTNQFITSEDEESDDELESSTRQKRTPQATSSRKRLRSSGLRNDLASSPLKTRSGRKANEAVVISSSEESEGGDTETVAQAASIFDIGEPETTGDEAPVLQSSPMRKRRRRRPTPDFIELSDDEEESVHSDVSEEPPAPGRKRLAQRKQIASENEFMSDDDEDDDGPIGRRSHNQSKTPRKMTDQELEDLNDDLDFLQSSPPPKLHNSKQKKPNARQNALEALKRSRASQAGPPIALPSSESDEASEEEFVDNRRDMFLEEPEDEDFVVADGPDDVLGVPNLPIEFSNVSRMKGKDLFKFAVEWMVQNKINPAFAKDDEIYNLAFRKLDDEVRGLAGSKFTSSAWTMEFTTALQSRPGITLMEYSSIASELMLEHCDACNRSGHPATWEIKFSGKPYDPKTLEEIDDGSDDDNDDNDDDEEGNVDYDHNGRAIPAETKAYHVGRYATPQLSLPII
jgi:hypothetical protein